jgi:imidazolonepropionase
MIDSGVIVAIASDFNPNAFCYSLVYAMQIAVIHSKFSLNEALVATTINAAFALNRSHSHGSLEKGKVADMLLVRSPNWQNLIYQMGQSRDLIKVVIKRGKVMNK